MLVDNAIYVDGKRVAEPASLAETVETCQAQQGMAWVGLFRPTDDEFAAVAEEFDLPALAVEDAIQAHQRPKMERYDETLFVVLRAARYIDSHEVVEFGEIHVFVGADFVITIRHAANPSLGAVRRRLEAEPELLRLGPEAVLYAIIDQVVDEYWPVVSGLENDIDEIEDQVFGGETDVSRRTYELTREVIEFQRAVKPLRSILVRMQAGIDKYGNEGELRDNIRDVEDHVIQVQEYVEAFRELLQNILDVNLAMVAVRQNEEVKALSEASISQNDEVKKVSAWAAILFAPTLVGTIYGMNFEHMPELSWKLGYPMALIMMAFVSVTLFMIFKRRGWIT